MRPHFIVSTGRSGSTLLAELLADHPSALSLSECFLGLGASAFPAGQLSATQFWDHLTRPRALDSLMLTHRIEPAEYRYRIDADKRFSRDSGLPPLCSAFLPFLYEDPDAAYAELGREDAQYGTATVGAHYQRLFNELAERFGRRVWVERSGGSLAYVGQLMTSFPAARFIHLYRDGPACATSMSRHASYRMALLEASLKQELGYSPYEQPESSAHASVSEWLRPMLPEHFDAEAFHSLEIEPERFGRWWSTTVLGGTRRLRAVPSEDVLHLCYERLLAEPGDQVERVLRFLGLDAPDPGWLASTVQRVIPQPPVELTPNAALIEACEPGMRRLRGIDDDTRTDGTPRRVRGRSWVGLPPGPSGGLATTLRQLLDDPETLLERCRAEFGDCFTLPWPSLRRHPRPAVILSDPAAVTELYDGGDALSTPVPSRANMVSSLGTESLFLLEGENHLDRRREISPRLHGIALRHWEHQTNEIVEREVAGWAFDQRLELGPRLADIALDTTVGVTLGDSDPGRLPALRMFAQQVITHATVWSAAAGRAGRGPSPRLGFDTLFTEELGARRAEPPATSTDVLSQLLTPRANGRATLSDPQLADEIMTMLLAGWETTSAGLAWAFELLMRHPESLARARRDAFDGDGRYLAAVVRETLRYKPPIGLINRTLRRPWSVLGYELPAGTDIGVSVYLLHHRSDLYPDPERFKPERFLTSAPPTFNYLPFGAGVRRCVGAAVAELEMRTVLRAVLVRAEPELAEPGPLPPATAPYSFTFKPRGETATVLRRRTLDREPVRV
jgi:cytochrome P450